jgi:AraC-like DNA-binding protein
MTTKNSLATTWLMMLRLIELHGIDTRQILQEIGVRPESIRDPRARLPSLLADVVFEKAAERIPDPAFALRAAECWHPSHLGAMGHAWLSSETLRTGLKRMERYAHILGNRFSYRCIEASAGLRFVYDHDRGDAPVGPLMADFTLSIIMDMCRTNLGDTLNPVSVNLRRPEPSDSRPYQDFYGCPICFDAREDSFLLDNRTADALLPTANQQLAALFDAILTEQLAAFSPDDLVSRCKKRLLQELTSGSPSIEALASALAMSPRTLQRRLGEHGLTYQRLLNETRYELARRYLDDPTRTLTEITFLLGFSEPSAFTRAFKHWTGQSPAALRERHPAPSG